MLAIAATSLIALLAGVSVERHWGSKARNLSGRLLEIVVYAVMPVVVFFTVVELKITGAVGAGLAFGWAERLVALGAAWLIGSKLLALSRPALGALMVVVAVANTGYLGIPLTALLLGNSHGQIGLAVTYDNLVNSPVVLLLGFGIGAAYGTRAGRSSRDRLKTFITRNPPLFAFIAALLMPDSFNPGWGTTLAHTLAIGIAPVGFFALGVNLMLEHDETGVRVFPPPFTAPIAVALAVRLLVAPAVMLGLSALVLKVPDTFLLEAAMPSGINALVVAHLYGLDMKVTVGAIAWSTTLVAAAAGTAAALGGL
jgi:malate permease and related proteins